MKYELQVVNNSTNAMSVCVYQTMPEDVTIPGIMSTAWFAKRLYPTTHARFDWSLNYQFLWDETGELLPGISFDADQAWDADLTSNNMVTLHCDEDGAYTFQDLTTNSRSLGSLVVLQDGSIPLKEASVGIGMGNSPAYVFQAQPNMSLVFTPHPLYWVTFGDYRQGQVLDTTQITNKIQVAFPPNVYTMGVQIDASNRLSLIQPSTR
ncbi:MAG: hypothetical protein ACM3XM_00985 [Mycobacterium leprae]